MTLSLSVRFSRICVNHDTVHKTHSHVVFELVLNLNICINEDFSRKRNEDNDKR